MINAGWDISFLTKKFKDEKKPGQGLLQPSHQNFDSLLGGGGGGRTVPGQFLQTDTAGQQVEASLQLSFHTMQFKYLGDKL